ncbi:unnamed protein product [Adineta steineri]|uniref:Protein kinase domain-containing protein n=1 Tax=Adineta steineri TaxID=433720 RepID=A0A814HLF1_9BILA|nr:unnamed protein product [Adineta steineri]CAF3876983.1 unnamed protein product [Adineta steineri]
MNSDLASDSTYSSTPTITKVRRTRISASVPTNPHILYKSSPYPKPTRLNPVSSCDSHSSFASNSTTKTKSTILNNVNSDKLRQHIEEQYKSLVNSEARYYYYIEDQSIIMHMDEQLKKATDGTYFIRPAGSNEANSDIAYILHFVSHNEIARIPICYNKERRVYSFLSGYGIGSEVRREYPGVDLLIQHKQQNTFYELQYPFRICLYQSIHVLNGKCIPLPDEIRVLDRQNTILHELAAQGLTHYFNELIHISETDNHSLQKEALFIRNKINGRNKQGLTPLILAVQAKKYDFVEILLNNKADINITDGQGLSPLHHACRQANHKMLKKLIQRDADVHYFNRSQTIDDTYQSNLSAFHYLAMAKDAPTKNIKLCATDLIERGCPLMPLTKEGKSPFDIAHMYKNSTYECVKIFCNNYQFNNLMPIEVSSRNEAKSMLSDLACPNILGKLRLRLKQYDKKDCRRKNGLFLFYKTRKTRSQPNEEYGLCVHYNEQVFVYPITQKYTSSIIGLSKSSWETIFNYSLITDTVTDDHIQIIVFKTYEELIYSHTKYKGLLPTVLTDFVRKENGELITMEATELLLPTDPISNTSEYDSTDSEFETDVDSIDHINLSDIHSIKLLDENRHRLIWLAKVRFDDTTSFSIIIKDYLPKNEIDLYKQYRLNEFNHFPQYQSNQTNEEFSYEFNTRNSTDYKYESRLLLDQLKSHPFIVHTFICNYHPKNDLRIFMEYLPQGNLHAHLTQLKPESLDPLVNAYHWIYQLAQVMAYLTQQKIVHRDLAARNILLKNEKYIKLSDFGLSRFEGVKLDKNDCTVSPPWAAPECFDRQQSLSSLADVWSFGVVIWEIYSFGTKPYEKETNYKSNSNSQQLIRLLKQFLVEQGRRLSKPDRCSASMYDLMCHCWNGTISKRPSFEDIINDLNEMILMKDCLAPFTREERKIWKTAKEQYLSIYQSYQPPSSDDSPYTQVEDENEDKYITISL